MWPKWHTMRRKLFLPWAAVRCGLLILLVAPGLKAPSAVRAGQPERRPLRVWSGLASWYGSELHGQPTASGQPFNMFASTAAHLTLPMGSLVRLVNPRTGRSQLVRINDRGPFVENREIDVSYKVARGLGIDHRGVSRIRLELLEVPKRR